MNAVQSSFSVRRVAGLILASFAVSAATSGQPTSNRADLGPIVELPPMIVAEPTQAQPWLYAAAGDTEFLSRCSERTTRAFIAAQIESHRALRELVPPEFFPTLAAPTVSILVPLGSMPTATDPIFRGMLEAQQDFERRAAGRTPISGSASPAYPIRFLPNQRLDDSDMIAAFTFLDEADFDGRRLVVAEEFLHALLTRRTPMLPQWLIEGLTGLYGVTKPRSTPPELPPLTWISPDDTAALRSNPAARRVLLPARELFSPDAIIGPGRDQPERRAVWRSQSVLFVRWALDPANAPAADALREFASRASREPTTERLFTECFGFGFAELGERLSDYLPTAVTTAVRLPARSGRPALSFDLRPATPAQIGRLRGEWERLGIPLVRERYPQFLPHYIEQARTTFRRATSRGERDPGLLAASALCEIDAGDIVAARPLLDALTATEIARPRIHLEAARLQWAELTRDRPQGQLYSRSQLEPVLAPLRRALRLTPLLPEAVLLALDASLRCSEGILPTDLSALVAAAPHLRRYSALGLRLGLLQLRNGQRTEARFTLETALAFVTNPAERARYLQVLAALDPPPANLVK